MEVAFSGNPPRFAVLLAAYEGEGNIREQLQSILDQENVIVKVIISVDPSRDGTAALVEEFANRDARVLMLPVLKTSGGAGQNFLRLLHEVDLAGFEYIAFADQDDIWYAEKLRRAIQVLQTANADGYSSNVLAFWEDGTKKLIDKAQKQQAWDFLFEAAGPGCTYVLKRTVVEDFKTILVSRSDEVSKIGLHDWFIYAFARSRGYCWTIDPKPSMAYRQHASNQVGVNTGWRAYLVRAKKIIGGWGISQARLIARLTGLENDPFCRPWRRPGRLGMLWLALNAYRARRKVSDRFVFAAACLLLAVVGDRSGE
jgi:rhamnosyltransferase